MKIQREVLEILAVVLTVLVLSAVVDYAFNSFKSETLHTVPSEKPVH